MAPRNSFLLYDRILDGQLEALLSDWRGQGLSIDDTTFRLRERLEALDVKPVSRDTVRRWLADLGIEAA